MQNMSGSYNISSSQNEVLSYISEKGGRGGTNLEIFGIKWEQKIGSNTADTDIESEGVDNVSLR